MLPSDIGNEENLRQAELMIIVCLNCYLIFVSYAALAQRVPELDYALIRKKTVNPTAAASPDVPPWHLCSSTVYFPSGIYSRSKNVM